MKKKYIFLFLLSSAFAIGTFLYQNIHQHNQMSALFLNKVEVLANSEVDPENPGGTCCAAENSSCIINDITVAGHYRYDGGGPCPGNDDK